MVNNKQSIQSTLKGLNHSYKRRSLCLSTTKKIILPTPKGLNCHNPIYFLNRILAQCPPNPKLLLSAYSIFFSVFVFKLKFKSLNIPSTDFVLIVGGITFF